MTAVLFDRPAPINAGEQRLARFLRIQIEQIDINDVGEQPV